MANRILHNKNLFYWLIVVCCCGMMFCGVGISVNCTGVFYVPIAKDLGVGRGDVATYVTIMNIVTGLLGPTVVRLSKKVPFRTLICMGSMLTVLSLASWSIVTSVWQLYVAAFLNGVGNAILGAVMISMIMGNWFRKSLGFATSLTFSVSGLAGVILNPVFQNFIDAFGWRMAHLFVAVIGLIVLLPAMFVVRLHPEDMGMRPYGASEADTVTPETVQNATVAEDHARTRLAYVVVLCAIGFIAAFLTGMGQHMSGFADSIGLTAASGATLVSAVMAGNMLSKIILGILCDRFGVAISFVAFSLFVTFGFFALSTLTGIGFAMMIVSAFLVGWSYSLPNVGMTQTTRKICSPTEANRVFANISVAAQIGSSVASSVIGYCYDFFGSYHLAAVGCTILSASIVLMLIWIFRDARKRG